MQGIGWRVGDPCDEGERLTRRGVETISDEGEDGRPM